MDKVSNTVINRILEKQVNGKSISVYFFLAALSKEDSDGNAAIYDINPHRIYRLMQGKHIKISYRQVCISLEELRTKDLISSPILSIGLEESPYYIEEESSNSEENMPNIEYDLSTIFLVDACVDFDKSNDVLQSKGYKEIPEILLTNVFYRMSTRAKRLFLYIYKHMLRTTQIFRNILKKETYNALCELLKVNRPQKIRDTIEEVKVLLKVSRIKWTMKVETYKFEISSIVRNTLLTAYAAFSVVNPTFTKVLSWKLMLWFKENGHNWDADEINQIIKVVSLWKWKDVIPVLQKYINTKTKKGVKNIFNYFNSLRAKAI